MGDHEDMIRINRNNNAVRFNMNLEIFEAKITLNDDEKDALLWYSRDEIKSMKSQMCIFVEQMKKKQICRHYDNVTLERMLEKYDGTKYSLQGIEALIDDDVKCQRITNIRNGIKAVLREQQKSYNKKRIRLGRRQEKYGRNNDEIINTIASCYIEGGNTVLCQQEAHSRGIEYSNNLI